MLIPEADRGVFQEAWGLVAHKGLAGFDEKAQSLFKMNLSLTNDEQMKNLSVENILALKEAIARDTTAAEFVIKLSKEFEGAKNVLNKMKNDGGAQV